MIDGEDRAGLDRDVEDLRLVVGHAEQRAGEDQVAGARDGQEFGQAFDDAHDGGLGEKDGIQARSPVAGKAGDLSDRSPAGSAGAGAGPARMAGRTDPLRPTRPTAMNIEQARFNMIEQQIRTWEVLDQNILSLLSVVKREDFVPPAYESMAFVDTAGAAAARRVDARAQGRGAAAAGARRAAPRARPRDRRRLGLHGRPARPPRAARDDGRDPSRAGPARRRRT